MDFPSSEHTGFGISEFDRIDGKPWLHFKVSFGFEDQDTLRQATRPNFTPHVDGRALGSQDRPRWFH